jgi:hypothetical protein
MLVNSTSRFISNSLEAFHQQESKQLSNRAETTVYPVSSPELLVLNLWLKRREPNKYFHMDRIVEWQVIGFEDNSDRGEAQ